MSVPLTYTMKHYNTMCQFAGTKIPKKRNSVVATSTDYKKNLNFRQRMHRKKKDQ